VPIYDHNRSLIRIVGNLRDISNIKNTEQLLRNADKLAAVGQLAAGIAHEIRNPLTTVQGMLQLSKDRFQPHYYDLILSELARMKLIVGEFLMLGKPQAIEFKQADCLLILNEVLSIYETQTIMNGISIETNFLKTQRMMCDANQIKQVFINILKNCLEALPYGGTIRIDLDVQGSHQLIRFKDDGEGMTEEILTKIGQPFCSTKKDGNGLGIMVTKKIIDSHKGQIHFSSGLNSGTTVEILLPCI
jgi:signal transduction histidine kinase